MSKIDAFPRNYTCSLLAKYLHFKIRNVCIVYCLLLCSTALGPVIGKKETFWDERFETDVKYLSFTGSDFYKYLIVLFLIIKNGQLKQFCPKI